MKPEFVTRWSTSKCGKWDIEAPAEGSPVRLNQKVFSFSVQKHVWVNVGVFQSVPEAIKAAQTMTAKGRAA